jgi:hypothetical protein
MPVVGYPLGYAAYIVSIPLVPKSKADHDNNRGIIDVEFSILKWDDAKAGESSSKTTIQTAVDSHFQNPDTDLKVLFKPRVVYRIHAFCTTQKHLRTYSWARAFALHTKMISCHRAIFVAMWWTSHWPQGLPPRTARSSRRRRGTVTGVTTTTSLTRSKSDLGLGYESVGWQWRFRQLWT